MIFLLFGAAAAEPSVLDDEAFRFCHEYGDFEYNSVFCDLLDGAESARCPGLQRYCESPEDAPVLGCSSPRGTAGPGATPSKTTPERSWETLQPRGCEEDKEEGTFALLRWGIALVVALLIAGFVIALLRFLGLRDRGATPPQASRPVEAEEEDQSFAEAVSDVPDLPSGDLLGAASAALARDELGLAAVLARGAVLRELGERREVRLHRARTDHEYVEQAAKAHRSDLAQVLKIAQQHRWGHEPLTRGLAEASLMAAKRLLALGLLFALISPAHAVDRFAAAGDVALLRVLREEGHRVSFRHQPFSALADSSELEVLVLDLSGIKPTDEDWESILTWVEDGHVLWVGGANPHLDPYLGPVSPSDGTPVLAEGFAGDVPRWPMGIDEGYREGIPWLELDSAAPIVWTHAGDGMILAFVDPALMWNGAFVVPENEAFIHQLLTRGEKEGWPISPHAVVELATNSDAEGGSSGSLSNLRLLPLVLQVLLLWVVVAAWKGIRFGLLRASHDRGRHRFIVHTEAVASHYERLGATHSVSSEYAQWVLSILRPEALKVRARQHGFFSDVDAEALVRDTVQLAESPSGENSPADFELMEDLCKVIRPPNN